MKLPLIFSVFALVTTLGSLRAQLPPELLAKLPPPAARPVDFVKDIKPLLEAACVKCHAKGKAKGEFSLETREAFLKGGETGPAALVGKSAESFVVEMVAAFDPDTTMPKKGTKWTAEQVGLLRAWIDQGALWPHNVSFTKSPTGNLQPRIVAVPEGAGAPIDRLLASYFATQNVTPSPVVEDRLFARRIYLDLIGLLPTPAQLEEFLQDAAPDKRAQLVRRLLADREGYTEHWLTFWNDLLRNDYKGVGFIDGGRKQISGWLYHALATNLPYDRFVAELVNPTSASEGFSRGIIWRGSVNASMLPPMQAAQNISQVFMGVNLKCASCHDSFINDWALSDAYGLAAVYADAPLELVHCDKPTGKLAAMRFLYPELGNLEANAAKPARLQRLAEIMTTPSNGRLTRTLVNRLWARLLGRGLVEPLDDMEKPAWSADMLDWLAEDFVRSGYDLKHTLEVICTSRAYQLPAVENPGEKETYVFRGPLTRRLTAEQFSDAISQLTENWNRVPSSLEFDFLRSGSVSGIELPKWIWTKEPVHLAAQRTALRSARTQLAQAGQQVSTAQQKVDAAAAAGTTLPEAQTAAEQAAKAVAAAQAQLQAATQIAPAAPGGATVVRPDAERHRVVFRKTFALTQKPERAFATVLASQRSELQVNGREAKPLQRDGFRNGRILLYDLTPLLTAGANVITVDVSSHTEKQMNEPERKQYPASATHLNAQSGLAFYAHCILPDGQTYPIGSDETWRVQRNPDGAWNTAGFADNGWATADPLPAGQAPVDEGPGLQPIGRQDFANLPVQLGSQLSPAVSTTARVGRVRAALLAADPLQVALDRPNREVIVPARAISATTLQALELTNGWTLDGAVQKAGAKFAERVAAAPAEWVRTLYVSAFTRPPTGVEQQIAAEVFSPQPTAENIADLLWAIVNQPEFQLIN